MNKETEERIKENAKRYIEIKDLYKIVDKLEQRISKLEKVLESHAKCIGEMREDNKWTLDHGTGIV